MRSWFLLLIICITFFSCEEQFGSEPAEISQRLIDDSLELFDGKLMEKSSTSIDGINAWIVTIENESGSVVSFYWHKSLQLLIGIEGEHGPFDYDLKPPLGILSLSTAKFLAYESYTTDELSSWELVRNGSTSNRWVYQFFLENSQSPMKIDGVTGDAL